MKMFIALLMAAGLVGTASAATTTERADSGKIASTPKDTGPTPLEGMFQDQVTSVKAIKIVCTTFTEKVKQDKKIGTKETKTCSVEKDANL